MYLEAFGRYPTVAEFDPASNYFSELNRLEDKVPPDARFWGYFDKLGGQLLLLYRVGEELFLRHNNQDNRIDDDVSASFTEGAMNRLLVTRGDETMVDITYPHPKEWRIPFDTTPFVEDEDFDFGLFIANVLTEPGRRRRVFRNTAA